MAIGPSCAAACRQLSFIELVFTVMNQSVSEARKTTFSLETRINRDTACIDLNAAGEFITASWHRAGDHIPCLTGPSRDLRGACEVQPESFSATVVADLLIDQREHQGLVASIVRMLRQEMRPDGLFHFFKDHELLPADADCTALAHSVLLRGGCMVIEQANQALNHILANSGADGVVETYFDPTGERTGIVDPVVCANVLYLATMLGRGRQLRPTCEYLRQVLVAREFNQGTRYYHSPDTFLYFTARLVRQFPSLYAQLHRPLVDAVRERQAETEFPLDIAQRVIVSQWLRIGDGGESQKLIDLQEDDGCWPADSLFRYGRKQIFFGSRSFTTAFALRALEPRPEADVHRRASPSQQSAAAAL